MSIIISSVLGLIYLAALYFSFISVFSHYVLNLCLHVE